MSNHNDPISQRSHLPPESADPVGNGPEPHGTPPTGATRRQFMKVGGSTLATLVTWNGLLETSKAVDQSSATPEFLIKGNPTGNPAGTSFNYEDHAIPDAAATLRIKTWCTPDPESHTTMKMECAGEVFGYGKVATTGRASLTATKDHGGREFTSVGNADPDPASAFVSPWFQDGFLYTMYVAIVASRNDTDASTNIGLKCTCTATITRKNASTNVVDTYSLQKQMKIEEYIIYRYPN